MTDEYYSKAVFYNENGQDPVKRFYTLEFLHDIKDEKLSTEYDKQCYDFFESINVKKVTSCYWGIEFLNSVGVYIENKEAVPYTLYYPVGCDVDKMEQYVLKEALKFNYKFKPIKANIDFEVLLYKEAHGELGFKRKEQGLTSLNEGVIKPNDTSDTVACILSWLNALNSKEQTVVITDNYLFPSQHDLTYEQDLKSILKFLEASKIEHYGMQSKVNRRLFNNVKHYLQEFGIVLEHYDLEDFHDRFWITKETEEGLVLGTSLNGIGRKFCYVNVISHEDAKTVLDYIK